MAVKGIRSLRYKNWVFILDQNIQRAIENNEDEINLKLTVKQAISFRGCIQEARLVRLHKGIINKDTPSVHNTNKEEANVK